MDKNLSISAGTGWISIRTLWFLFNRSWECWKTLISHRMQPVYSDSGESLWSEYNVPWGDSSIHLAYLSIASLMAWLFNPTFLGKGASLEYVILKARKSNSHKVHHQTWKAYFTWCKSVRFHDLSFSESSLSRRWEWNNIWLSTLSRVRFLPCLFCFRSHRPNTLWIKPLYEGSLM